LNNIMLEIHTIIIISKDLGISSRLVLNLGLKTLEESQNKLTYA